MYSQTRLLPPPAENPVPDPLSLFNKLISDILNQALMASPIAIDKADEFLDKFALILGS